MDQFFAFWKPPPVVGSVTKDASEFTDEEDSVMDFTFNHTQGSLTKGYVVVLVAALQDSASSVTYNGNSMSQLCSATYTDANSSIWLLPVGTSASGLYPVVVNMNLGTGYSRAACATYNGVFQSTYLSYANNGGRGTSIPAGTLATQTTDIVVGVCLNEHSLVAGPTDLMVSDYFNAGSQSGTGSLVNLTWTQSPSTVWAACATNLHP